MASLEEIRQTRLEKLEILKKNGMEPYPAESFRTHALSELIEHFEKVEKEGKDVCVAGRIMSLRAQGSLAFFHLFDGSCYSSGRTSRQVVGHSQELLLCERQENFAGNLVAQEHIRMIRMHPFDFEKFSRPGMSLFH